MSIIIVGVGDDGFSRLESLDSDGKRLFDSVRDIVQFVPFRKYRDNPSLLAKQILAELPNQVVDYMRFKRIVPTPPTVFEGMPPLSEIAPVFDPVVAQQAADSGGGW
eukprot:JP438948.1.p1 GENE.JP438948.1~~JP438948.1.p1  ORF type:complete len:107 (-),score=7.26 JP438948.1:107-427(-)